MKNILTLLFVIVLFLSLCSGQKELEPQISLNDSTCIKIIAENISDTIKVQTQFCSQFPFRPCNFKGINITKPGIYFITYKMTKPELVKFTIGDTFQLLLIPGDTTVLNVGSKISDNKESSVYHNFSGNINEYFQVKKKKFGYYSFFDISDNPVYKFFQKMKVTQTEYKEALNVLTSQVDQNAIFLTHNKKNLPKWFFDVENANITYGSAYINLLLYRRLSTEDQKEISAPIVKFNNPKALLSSAYYAFVMEYLYLKCPVDNSVPHLVINQYKAQAHLVDSLLSGENKDYFITCRLADLYFFSNSAEDIKYADTLLETKLPQLNTDKIKFISYEKAQIVKFLKIKNSLPQGDKAPGFYLKDANGKVFELSSFKNKIVYLHFWATWCEPCIKEIPVLNQLYLKFDKQSFELVNICLDNNLDKWKQIIDKANLKGINLICKGNWEKSLKECYFITELPHFALIDRNGLIINNKCPGPQEIYSEITQNLNKK